MFSKENIIVCLLIVSSTLFIYILTLCPTVYIGDSGEFISNASVLGINHRPGFPLYTLSARVFSVIFFFSSKAFSVNLLSAVISAITAGIFFFALLQLNIQKTVSVVISLSLGFSFTFWSRATSAEIYAVNSLFIIIVFLCASKYYKDRDIKFLYAAAYFSGLGLSQHLTGVQFGIITAIFILTLSPKIIFKPRSIIPIILFFIIGLSVYFYLPARSAVNPPLDRGDPETLQRLLDYILPSESMRLVRERITETDNLSWLLSQLFTKEFWYFGFLAIPAYYFRRKESRLLIYLSLIIIVNSIFFLNSPIPLRSDLDAQFILTFICWIVLIGFTLDGIIKYLYKKTCTNTRKYSLVILVFPVLLLLLNYNENDKSSIKAGYYFGKDFLDNIERNGIVFVKGDEEAFIPWYFQLAENYRNDVNIVPVQNLPQQKLNIDDELATIELKTNNAAKTIIEQNIGESPIYYTFEETGWDFLTRYTIIPQGLTSRIALQKSYIDYRPFMYIDSLKLGEFKPDYRMRAFLNYQYLGQSILNTVNLLRNNDYKNAAHEITFAEEIKIPKNDLQLYYIFLLKGEAEYNLKNYNEALASFNRALDYGEGNWRLYEIRGNTYWALNKTDNAKADWEKSVNLNPGNLHLKNKLKALDN